MTTSLRKRIIRRFKRQFLNADGEAEFENFVKEDPEISEYNHVPDITALADRLRSCL
jgi:hypothetical protein